MPDKDAKCTDEQVTSFYLTATCVQEFMNMRLSVVVAKQNIEC